MMWRLAIWFSLLIVFLGAASAYSDEPVPEEPSVPIEITTPSLPSGYRGDGYSTPVEARGGRGTLYFLSGSLPKGLNLSSSGLLQGKLKMEPGTHTFLVTAVDPEDPDNYDDRSFSLTVFEKLRIDRQDLAPAMTGQPYQQQLNFTGGSPACTLSVTGLPQGLVMDESGLITGTPETGAAKHDLSLTVTDPDYQAHTATRTLKLTVYDALAITTDSPPPLRIQTSIKLRLETSGGSGKVVFQSADLPEGLTLEESGRLSGTPVLSRGIYPFTISATEQTMPVTVQKTLNLTVVDFFPDDYEELEKTNENRLKPDDRIQEHTFNEPGDEDRLILDLSQTPAGEVLRLTTLKRSKETRTRLNVKDPNGQAVTVVDESTGDGYTALLFVNETPGAYDVTVTEETGGTGDYGLSFKALGPKIRLTTQSLPHQQNLGPVDLKATAEKGSGEYRFEITGLPKDLTMDEAGHIQGQLTAPAGDFPLTLTVTDTLWGKLTDSQRFPLTVVDFFPDTFEPNDGDFNSTNVMIPGDAEQPHTFHTPGDRDGVKLDLSGREANHVLHIQTQAMTRETRTKVAVYDETSTLLVSDEKSDTAMSGLYVDAAGHPSLFLMIDESRGKTGDYGLAVQDMGKKLSIKTASLPDALTRGPYTCQIRAVDGSGDYRFSGTSLPKGLTIDPQGLLHGDLDLKPGTRTLTLTVADATYTGMSHTIHLPLKVVEFFPDQFEAMADSGFESTATLLPDGEHQEHTFHKPGDTDVIRLDLSAVPHGHVLDIRTHARTKPTTTFLELYDPAQGLVIPATDGASTPGSRWITECPGPGVYWLKVRTKPEAVGDYAVSVSDGGPKVRLVDQEVPDVLIKRPMSFQVAAADGSGQYRFVAQKLPPALSMDQNGLLSGDVGVPAGLYPFEVTVTDPMYPGIKDTRSYTLKVVDYFPDEFDVAGDVDEETRNVFVPGGPAQRHCFHEKGDVDWIKLDLTGAAAQDVIVLGMTWPGKETHTVYTLTDAKGNPRDLVDKGSVLVFSLDAPGELLLCVREKDNQTGEYIVNLNNSGQPVTLTTEFFDYSESAHPYTQPLDVKGGCGEYTFKIIGGKLPEGLGLDGKTGLISGQNKVWGTFSIKVLAMDRRFPVNATQRSYTLDAYMGEKLHGEDRFVFPFYLSGTFSLDVRHTRIQAFPGDIRGGTPGNLRYRIMGHSIPEKGFSHSFDIRTGILTLTGLTPVSCNKFTDTRIDVEVEVKDHIHTNNSMVFHYDIPAECLEY